MTWARAGLPAAVTGMLLSTMLVLSVSDAAMRGTTANAGNEYDADQIQPASTLKLVADPISCRFTLGWTATPSTWADGHKVYRSTSSGGPFTLFATVDPYTTTTFEDRSMKTGLRYWYRVRAYRGNWTSSETNTVDGWAQASCV